MTALVQSFDRLLRDRPQALALSCGRGLGSRTFGELDQASRALQALVPSAVDSTVALSLANGTLFVEAFVAFRRLGLSVALLDASFGLVERLAQCRELGLCWLCTTQEDLAEIEAGDGGLEEVSRYPLTQNVFLLRLSMEPARMPPQTSVVKLTSGSTGTPMGVCLDDEALVTGIHQIAEAMDLSHRDRVLLSLPLSHSYGFDSGLISLMVIGTPLILQPPVLPARLLSALVEHRATFLPLVPSVVHALTGTPWPKCPDLRLVISAGGRLLPEVAVSFYRASGVPVQQFYGSTETGGISFESRPLDPDAVDCVGFPLPGVEIEFDAEGALTVHSGANYCGYVGQEGGQGPLPVSPGDVGEWTSKGRLRLLGRSNEILNVGGRKVAVATVERALGQLGGVTQVAVVGVDDPARGDRVVAFYCGTAETLDVSDLPARLQPRVLRRLDSMPVTSRGKLDRKALRERASLIAGGADTKPSC